MVKHNQVTPTLSIVIVNFNTKDHLERVLVELASSQQAKEKTWEIIVVDNASTDGSDQLQSQYPAVYWIANTTNTGFAKANNKGMKVARAGVILLLNSDTMAQTNAIEKTYAYLTSQASVGVITCKVVLPSGGLDSACHRGFPTPWASFTYMSGLERVFPRSVVFGQYHLGFEDLSTIHEIDSPSGAFYMIKRQVIQDVGPLDEAFFMYGEDLDWSYRIKQKGWHIIFYPFAQIIHVKKQSGRESSDSAQRKVTQAYFYDTMRLFYRKHYAAHYPFFVSWAIEGIIYLRLWLG